MESSMINNLTTGSVPGKLIRFSIPFILANLLQFLYNIVDMVIVGQFVGSAGLSAVSIGAEFMHFLTFIAVGFAQAGQIMIAQSIGNGVEHGRLSRIIGNLFTFILGLSVIVTIVSVMFPRQYAVIMNTPTESFAETVSYCAVCGAGMFFVYGYNIVSNIMQGMGDSKHPLLFVAIAAGINLVLDLLFVGAFHLRSMGAALATVLGQAFSFIISMIYLYRRRDAFGFDFRLQSFRPDRGLIASVVKLGIPITLQSIAISVSMMYVTACINTYGVIYSAVNGVANKISQLCNIISASLRASGSSMTGQNFGAGRHDRVSSVFWYVLFLSMVFAILLSAIVLLFPTQIFRLFDDDPAVLLVSMEAVPVIVVNFFGAASRTPVSAFINGIGYAGMNFIMGIMDGVVVRIGLAVLMGKFLGMGVHGYWYGSAIAGFVFFLVVFPYFLSGRWKGRKTLVEQ